MHPSPVHWLLRDCCVLVPLLCSQGALAVFGGHVDTVRVGSRVYLRRVDNYATVVARDPPAGGNAGSGTPQVCIALFIVGLLATESSVSLVLLSLTAVPRFGIAE